jgi:2-dehydro-3-deoxyphosphogluconate aldolase/(4S)-4-hydroxy-2-oxoglutarate aldolase
MTDEQATMRTRDSGPGAEPFAHWAEFFARALSEVPLVAILRGLGADEAVRAAREAWDAGVPLVEVTVERPEGVDALRAVVEAAPEGHTVGAGTVTTPERLDLARKAGARFAIAPGLDDDTVRSAQEHDLPFLPGVATPSEAARALALGVNTVKVFPASVWAPPCAVRGSPAWSRHCGVEAAPAGWIGASRGVERARRGFGGHARVWRGAPGE